MEHFTESLDKVSTCVFCRISYLIHLSFMAHVVWGESGAHTWEEKKKHLNFILKLCKNTKFGADDVIYMAKMSNEIQSLNQWDLYNSIADNVYYNNLPTMSL